MNEAFYRQTSEIEERHWWFVHRRRLVRRVLRRFGIELSRCSVLDVGCGSGGNLRWFEGRCASAVGVDRSPVALGIAREKGPASLVVQADACLLDECLAPGSFDLVTLFNVLYHRWVDDVQDVLKRLARLLRPGGHLLLTEPALQSLFRSHDLAGHGARRFRRGQIERMLTGGDLEPLQVAYFNVAALPPAFALACLDRLRGATGRPSDGTAHVAELGVPPNAINRALLAVSGVERLWIGAGLPVPAGVTLLAIAKRP